MGLGSDYFDEILRFHFFPVGHPTIVMAHWTGSNPEQPVYKKRYYLIRANPIAYVLSV
jgi:hypothetical protein